MSFKIKTLGLFLIAAFFTVNISCGILDSSGKKLKPIEGNIIFNIKEGYRNYNSIGEPHIMLTMVTEKIYSIHNFSIISHRWINGNKIIIDLMGIKTPEFFQPLYGPARSTSFLNIHEGEYLLYFSYKDTTDIYTLIVTDSSIRVVEDTLKFTVPEFTLFWRYPPNSFIYLCRTPEETSWIYSDFLDTLMNEITFKEFQFPDSGINPYLPYGDRYYYMPAKYFFYEKDKDFDKAGEILKSYTQDITVHYSDIEISLRNWKNKTYSSELFDN